MSYKISELVTNIMKALIEAGDHAAVGQLFKRLFHLGLIDRATPTKRVPAPACPSVTSTRGRDFILADIPARPTNRWLVTLHGGESRDTLWLRIDALHSPTLQRSFGLQPSAGDHVTCTAG